MPFLKNFIPIVLSLLVMLFISIFWHKISLPYENINDIIGEYSKKNHHQFNDTLRFIIFIFFTLLVYLISFLTLNKDKVKSINDIIFEKQIDITKTKNHLEKNIYLLIFVLIIIFNFCSSNLPDYNLDIFHEGQLLSGAINYSLKDKLWTGSYINTGLFYDILNTKIAWYIFGNESIGSYRIFNLLLNHIFVFLVILFAYSISKIFNLSKNKEIIFFITLSLFCIFFYNITYLHFPNYRDLFSIIFLICLINTQIKNKFYLLNYFLIGSLSILSLLWSLDRGIFLNATIFFFIIVLLLRKKLFEILIIILGIISLWLLFLLIVGLSEFNEFFSNSINILRYNELWNGIIHPQPFSDEKNSTRATKVLIIFVLNGIILINYLIKRNNDLNINSKIFLVITFVLSIFYYKVGLSRSDGGHIVIGSSISTILFIILLTYKLVRMNLKKFLLDIIFEKKFYLINSLLILMIFTFYQNSKAHSWQNFLSFKSRINNFIALNDNFFLKSNYLKFINQMKIITKDSYCIQNLNYDPTIYYILKKESCTKYYLTFNIATKIDQIKFIEEMEHSKPKIFIVDSNEKKYSFSAFLRFPLIRGYLDEKYQSYKNISENKILKRKN
jgi:hypothetical protein|tara:strand:+ start:2105 stop:3946 length:1842 start_codon:yes stop_codon:yes gene_type:complete